MNVGDYVRTNQGYIAKIIKINKDSYLCDNWTFTATNYTSEHPKILKKEKIKRYEIKSSPNIIDLMEKDDYINGLIVEKNKYGELYTSYVYYGGDIGKQCEVYTTWLKDYKEDEIYSIVTKEQFERMEYKVKE